MTHNIYLFKFYKRFLPIFSDTVDILRSLRIHYFLSAEVLNVVRLRPATADFDL